jgi:hypothetical protein
VLSVHEQRTSTIWEHGRLEIELMGRLGTSLAYQQFVQKHMWQSQLQTDRMQVPPAVCASLRLGPCLGQLVTAGMVSKKRKQHMAHLVLHTSQARGRAGSHPLLFVCGTFRATALPHYTPPSQMHVCTRDNMKGTHPWYTHPTQPMQCICVCRHHLMPQWPRAVGVSVSSGPMFG